jgi:hypothetical protein
MKSERHLGWIGMRPFRSVLLPTTTEVDYDPNAHYGRGTHHADLLSATRRRRRSPLVRGDTEQHRERVLGLPVSLVRRLLPQRQYFGRQPRLVQSEPVLCRQRCRTHALSETPRSPAVAAAPDMSSMSAIGGKADMPFCTANVRL